MNRAELEARLDQVAASVPSLRIEHADFCDLMMALAGKLDVIEDGAIDAADAAYVSARVDKILAAASLPI